MSEHWKSTPKYWCKHCSTYVKDTPFERKQHESTGRHQGNLKRFLRDIQTKHERDERDRNRAKAEVERLNKKVGIATSASLQSTYLSHNPHTSHKIQASVGDRKRQMAQLAEMGIQIPAEERGDLSLAGQWKTVSQNIVEEMSSEEPLSTGIHKRKYEGQEEEEEAGEAIQRRGWGANTKMYPSTTVLEIDELLTTSKKIKAEDNDQGTTAGQVKDQVDAEPDSTRGNVIIADEDTKTDVKHAHEEESIPLFKKRRPKSQAT